MEGTGSKSVLPCAKPASAGRFVVLVESGSARPERLLTSLHHRGSQVRLVLDPPQAMVELAQFHAKVLIVHQPARMAELESLLSAVRLYHPEVVCWRHEPAQAGQRERLLPFTCELNPADEPRFARAPANGLPGSPGHVVPSHAARPASKLGETLASSWPAWDDLSAGPLLSAEEIALLRGSDDSDRS